MKFKYYLADLMDGKLVGTNDEQIAMDHSHIEEYFVLNTETGMWIIDGEEHEVSEIKGA